jgi:hypothetical protein
MRIGEVEASPGERDAFGADRGLSAARLLARSAASIRPVMAGPAVPAATAARAAALIWATIWSSPTAIDSSPHATENKCSAAAPPSRMLASPRTSAA